MNAPHVVVQATLAPGERRSLEAHRSQASDIDQFLSMPPEVFARFFGSEYYIEPGVAGPMRRGWPYGDAD